MPFWGGDWVTAAERFTAKTSSWTNLKLSNKLVKKVERWTLVTKNLDVVNIGLILITWIETLTRSGKDSFLVLSICRKPDVPSQHNLPCNLQENQLRYAAIWLAEGLSCSQHMKVSKRLWSPLVKKTRCVAEFLQDSRTDGLISGWLSQTVLT